MKTEHYFCDQCKKEVEVDTQSKRPNLLKFTFGVGDTYHSSYSRFEIHSQYELCFPCAEKIGFKKVNVVTPVEFEKSTTEKLYDVFSEIKR